MRWLGSLLAISVLMVTAAGAANAADGPEFTPGAAGAGDPYFPKDGNGGYDVQHYLLDVKYDPATDVLEGTATLRIRATQHLSRFNLDLDGLTVHSIAIDRQPATWSRRGGELRITPPQGIRKESIFQTVIRYSGTPEPIVDLFGESGFLHTDDGTLVIGQPHVAATWYPVNDHPSDKAPYRFRITVPEGLEAVANGVLEDQTTTGGWTTWSWTAREPVASYLTTATIGEFDLRAYSDTISGDRRIRYWDALDPDLFDAVATPRTGEQFLLSQQADSSYKRLVRTISVPAGGARLSFWVTRDTEVNWDYFFVEARTAGGNDRTTLRDLNGHTSRDTGFSCPAWLELHPNLAHYQSARKDGSCKPRGTTGRWRAASGASEGPERWVVNLSRFAGSDVRVSLSYASDESIQNHGVFIDDIVVSTGEGSTSFEEDGDTRDGWRIPGPPAGSPPNENDWIVGTAADTPPPLGVVAENSLARQNEILEFLSGQFGRYPFDVAGGIVDDDDRIQFALENQTRPIYAKVFFYDAISGDSVVVHELAHQWFGDSLAVAAWQHIWLNEGFATYAEWLWSEREGLGTAQEIFDDFASIPADDPFWSLPIGDPGPDFLFEFPVYGRGAMTLHALRLEVGDEDFFRILRRWAASNENGNVTTPEFIELAESMSGQSLDALFDAWLFTPAKPDIAGARTVAPKDRRASLGVGARLQRLHMRR